MLGKLNLSNKSPILLFVVNAPEFFLSHRLPLAIAAKSSGYEVHLATAPGLEVDRIKSLGFTCHVVPFSRSGQNPFKELKTLLCLIRLFVQLKPSLVHLVTIKPVLYGGIAARLTRIRSVVSAVSGLGTVFMGGSLIARARRRLIAFLYRAAFSARRLSVIFQNPDDRDTLLRLNALKPGQVRMIRGSGVDLSDYSYIPEPKSKGIVVMAARLLKDKGVYEYVEAAKLLKQRGVSVDMRLIGSPDSGNPSSIAQQELDQWVSEGVIEALGHRKDVAMQYVIANIVCLPSYREGLPKCLAEAAACGRAVVTTDVPGCRDAIEPGKTGVLVPVKNAEALADAIQDLIENPDKRQAMGKAGRELAEREFAIEKIVQQHMDIYRELLDAE